MAASEVKFWSCFEMNFFRIPGTLVSGKAECLLAMGEDKKVSFLE